MHINPQTGAVTLEEEGEVFKYEVQDEGNITRTATFMLHGQREVTIRRHFSQIGPSIIDHEGYTLTTVVRDGKVVPIQNTPCGDSMDQLHDEHNETRGPNGFIKIVRCPNCGWVLREKTNK